MINSIVGAVAALVVGGGIAGATVFGLVSSQTSAPADSPGNAEKPFIQYGDRD
ncbi:DUF2613 family protein [Nocardioides massiliensis]|uniref:DUF2613 family protein n=1 Tax=Nocardioides massiliensis TaxID=1325935 RepID=A0ABT9NT11_9ACTN|nr:DUF2613 family protein [Nocardioides massiliensis]MDP9823456.1 hypothetical protein [Nocardioides massiliensis]